MQDNKKINEQIRARVVRLIGPDESQLGVRSLNEALNLARTYEMDLVEVAPSASPPVCKIMDYGKYLFDLKKKKKKPPVQKTKEVKFRPHIEDGDYDVKIKNIIRFIESGDRVKISLKFQGREILHKDIGQKLMERVRDNVISIATIQGGIQTEGRSLSMLLVPISKK